MPVANPISTEPPPGFDADPNFQTNQNHAQSGEAALFEASSSALSQPDELKAGGSSQPAFRKPRHNQGYYNPQHRGRGSGGYGRQWNRRGGQHYWNGHTKQQNAGGYERTTKRGRNRPDNHYAASSRQPVNSNCSTTPACQNNNHSDKS